MKKDFNNRIGQSIENFLATGKCVFSLNLMVSKDSEQESLSITYGENHQCINIFRLYETSLPNVKSKLFELIYQYKHFFTQNILKHTLSSKNHQILSF